MKKLFITLLAGGTLLGGAFLITPQLTKNSGGELAGIIDRFNPLIPQGEVYVKTKKADEVNGYGTATYRQTAVDKEGQTRKVEFSGISELKVDRYLKLKNKGAYVETYEEVFEDEIPAAALAVLKN